MNTLRLARTLIVLVVLSVVLTLAGCIHTPSRLGNMNPVWSPDGTKIIFSTRVSPSVDVTLHVMNADGSGKTAITDTPAILGNIVWSPDSSQIYVALQEWDELKEWWGDFEIRAVRVDGGGSTVVASGLASFMAPEFVLSPDGSRIAFMVLDDSTSYANKQNEIHVVLVDGSGEINLSDSRATDWAPVWLPDGNKISFLSSLLPADPYDVSHVGANIIIINPDGTDRKNLTNSSDYKPEAHVWSPDGSKVYFTKYVQGGVSDTHYLFVMNADGSGQISLADGYKPRLWGLSPDGSRITFSSRRENNVQIFVVNADGTGLTNLADGLTPVWSPDGNKIAFVSQQPGKRDICVVGADGTGHVTLATVTGYDSAFIDPPGAWSPDGTKIAFSRGIEEEMKWEPDLICDIYAIDADGGKETLLTGERGAGALWIIWIVVPIVVVVATAFWLIRRRRRRLSQQEPHVIISK